MKHYRLSTVLYIVILSFAVLASSALAGSGYTSTKTIAASSSGEYGPYVPMYGKIYISGNNSANATNTLYVASQPRAQGTYKTVAIAVGDSLSGYWYNGATDDYRVLLDPSGPLATGCIGRGTITNP